MKCFIAGLAVFGFLQVNAQDQNNTAQEKTGRQQNTSAAGKQIQNETNAADTAKHEKTRLDESSAKTNATESGNTSNTPGLMEHTSSPSGSPAILSRGEGSQRDGTNNVQRATMNMAGSPVSNLGLTGNEVDVNRPSQRGRSKVGEGANNSQSNQINNKTRRENNDLSDQNRSSKSKGAKIMEQNTKKRKRNGKR